jgi:protein-S-isoprenylcysteine O-methyltransferase Ste14
MRRAAAGSVAFLVLAPGCVAALVPWLLTGWGVDRTYAWPWRALGWALVAAGAAVLVHAFRRFVTEGVGTPAPVAPTERLVVGGLYRYVRNPMYLAVAAVICGQALILGRPWLFAYAALFGAAVWSFVTFYEEPTLARRYGAQYDAYRAAVPGWHPRLRPRRVTQKGQSLSRHS